jgi:hypothetical protein
MSATFGTISSLMRLSLFTHIHTAEPGHPSASQQPAALPAAPQPRHGKTFPADEIVWGIVIRNGFDELDDPWYHRGTTQHAYLEGNDDVAICGFRPPQSGPRTRRRSRLGLPTPGEHPMCGICARMVVAPRPRVPIAVNPARPVVPVPVVPGSVPPRPVAAPVPVVPRASVMPGAPAGTPPMGMPPSPRVQQAPGAPQTSPPTNVPRASSPDAGPLARGVRADAEG